MDCRSKGSEGRIDPSFQDSESDTSQANDSRGVGILTDNRWARQRLSLSSAHRRRPTKQVRRGRNADLQIAKIRNTTICNTTSPVDILLHTMSTSTEVLYGQKGEWSLSYHCLCSHFPLSHHIIATPLQHGHGSCLLHTIYCLHTSLFTLPSPCHLFHNLFIHATVLRFHACLFISSTRI